MKRVQLSVSYPDRFVHPIQRRIVSDLPITRAELLMWSPTEDATTLLWCDGDRDATAQAVADVESLVASNFVEDADGTYAFLRQDDYEFPAVLLELVADARVIFLPPVTFLETGDVQFEAVGESEALGAFHEELSALGDLTVERVREFERRDSPSRLTDRQRAALDAAVSVGYYDVPRNGTVADVADALDCSSSTAGELLRKAEAAVISDYTETR
ncbi:helix-turn-helix domain-containing protein [Halorussus sp. MSC15.2]|uniref:helix-turn-helix domain-containing protein n=1 Tax=Halorussus sp. MSC15.2 TaxID=2283638 RepID=UPI0013D53691|nr:helix-turn-helix domain-containing protein [Halorussus sp. MSC15.2]NEU56225.1 bacterio-opsin activator [Halorussus sp. MSC15.2]